MKSKISLECEMKRELGIKEERGEERRQKK